MRIIEDQFGDFIIVDRSASGGGVTGAPGHNAAKAILSDLRLGFSHLQ